MPINRPSLTASIYALISACVVSDDCGAWWPEDPYQKVKEIKLKK